MKRLMLLVFVLFVVSSQGWAAPSLQYVLPGTVVSFCDAGQGCTRQLTFANKGNVLQMSAQHDKGTLAQPADWVAWCNFAFTGTNVVGETVEMYVAWGDNSTRLDGGISTSDSTPATAKKANLKLVYIFRVDQTASNTSMPFSFPFRAPHRYFSLGFYNATSLSTQSSASAMRCDTYPIPVQMQ